MLAVSPGTTEYKEEQAWSNMKLILAKRNEVKELVDEMRRRGVIGAPSGPWSSPAVLVKRKDGSTRFCIDYRKLNNVIKKNSYPLPRIDNTLYMLAGTVLQVGSIKRVWAGEDSR